MAGRAQTLRRRKHLAAGGLTPSATSTFLRDPTYPPPRQITTGVLGLYFPIFDAVENADDAPTVTATDAPTVEAPDGRSATAKERGGCRHPD